MNKRMLGSRFEEKAAAYLRSRGMRILVRNYRCYRGEIDIVAAEGSVLVFVEVKFRSSTDFGRGVYHVDKRKQAKIAHAAGQYLLRYYPSGGYPPCRFDVIDIDGEGQITHYLNAFEK